MLSRTANTVSSDFGEPLVNRSTRRSMLSSSKLKVTTTPWADAETSICVLEDLLRRRRVRPRLLRVASYNVPCASPLRALGRCVATKRGSLRTEGGGVFYFDPMTFPPTPP